MFKNPCVDPQPGDVLTREGETRTVIEIKKTGAIVYRSEQERICDPKAWTGWAKVSVTKESA